MDDSDKHVDPIALLVDGKIMYVYEWPDCAVEGCEAKCCKRLHSPYCFPCTERARSAGIWEGLS